MNPLSVVSLVGLTATLWLARALVRWQQARRSASWPEAIGEVVESRVEEASQRAGSAKYVALVRFKYEANAQQFVRAPWSHGAGSFEWASQVVGAWPVGSQLELRYDPRHPEEYVLHPEVEERLALRQAAISFGVLVLLMVVLLATRFPWLRPPPPSPSHVPVGGPHHLEWFDWVGLALLFGDALVFGLSLHRWLETRKTAGWNEVPAVVLESSVQDVGRRWRPSIRYAYNAGGERRESERVWLEERRGSRAWAERFVAQFPSESHTHARVHPLHPERAVLDSRVPRWVMGALCVSGALFSAVVICLYAGLLPGL